MKQFASWFTHGIPGGATLRKQIFESRERQRRTGRHVEQFFETRRQAIFDHEQELRAGDLQLPVSRLEQTSSQCYFLMVF